LNRNAILGPAAAAAVSRATPDAIADAAVREEDATRYMRLAHYSKSARGNVGASSAAAIPKHIEKTAANRDFHECSAALARLNREVHLLRSEGVSL
jgi:hypothetical protein